MKWKVRSQGFKVDFCKTERSHRDGKERTEQSPKSSGLLHPYCQAGYHHEGQLSSPTQAHRPEKEGEAYTINHWDQIQEMSELQGVEILKRQGLCPQRSNAEETQRK